MYDSSRIEKKPGKRNRLSYDYHWRQQWACIDYLFMTDSLITAVVGILQLQFHLQLIHFEYKCWERAFIMPFYIGFTFQITIGYNVTIVSA